MDAVILYSTWPDAESAEKAAEALIEARLAACVTLLPQARSFYRWKGAVQADAELVMLAKTTQNQAQAAHENLLTNHPYELPCILALPVSATGSHAPYMAWLADETNGPGATGF